MMHNAIETFDPEGRGPGTTWTAGARLFLSLTVHVHHYKARSRRLRSSIDAMALATLATSQPYRLRDSGFSCAMITIKTGENY